MADFLADDNLCGQTLLRLVSRGSAIIAELLRLGDNIPPVFLGREFCVDPDDVKYTQVLFDFQYLKTPEEMEKRVNASTELLEADDEFQENHLQILERFYTLFDSIFKYVEDYKKFLKDLATGFYIQHTVDGILLNTQGKQLMCEALYMLGVMLLFLDQRIPGPVRERIIIAYYRNRGESNLQNIDDVCRLCRSTGFLPSRLVPVDAKGASSSSSSSSSSANQREPDGSRRPAHYPDDYFARLELPSAVVRMVIDSLRNDDVYLMSRCFPSPAHRSTRLANQASMLYVVLYFTTDILEGETSTMREIVDKFFADNWILPLYMGVVVDLSEQWTRYRAARLALNNTLELANVQACTLHNAELVQQVVPELKAYLTEGALTEQYLLDNFALIQTSLQKCNVALRWRLLHRTTRSKKLQEIIVQRGGVDAKELTSLLLNTAQMEWKTKQILEELLGAKEQRWMECRAQTADRMRELSEYFSGEKALTRVERDESLMAWFTELASQISALEYTDATLAGRKIQQLIAALEEVEQFEQIYGSLQIKAFLDDSRQLLMQMIRVVNVSDSVMDVVETVSDLSYAWELIEGYKEQLHSRVRGDPTTVVLLRALFLKLASILDVPLIRINQCDSPDTISVAEYYSGELVDFVRRVLEIVPVSVFRILTKIVDIQTSRLRPLPVRLEAIAIKEYAQLDERYELAKLTHQVSVFTEGILAMEKTLLGVLQVEPRQILEDGIRKELVRQVSSALHNSLMFKQGNAAEAEHVLSALSLQMSGFRRSIEYIQDYINLAGLRMFQEELFRIVHFNVEQEVNRYLKKKVLEASSQYQSRAIPIPRLPPPPGDNHSATFVGRLMQVILKLTDYRWSIYAPESSGWYTSHGQEVCGLGTFSLLQRSVDVLGLTGLDRVLSFRTVHALNRLLSFYRQSMAPLLPMLRQLDGSLSPHWRLPEGATKLYAAALKKAEKVMAPLLELVQAVGQFSLIRKQISNVLNFSCHLDANLLSASLCNLNKGVLNDVRAHYRAPDTHPYPADSNPVLGELNRYLDSAGVSDPLTKIYITTEPVEGLPVLLLLFTIAYSSKLQYDGHFGTLIRRKEKYPIDGTPMVVGLATLLHQFHPSYTQQYMALLGQFVRTTVGTAFSGGTAASASSVASELPLEAVNVLLLLDQFCRFARVPRDVIDGFVPPYVFDALDIPSFSAAANAST